MNAIYVDKSKGQSFDDKIISINDQLIEINPITSQYDSLNNFIDNDRSVNFGWGSWIYGLIMPFADNTIISIIMQDNNGNNYNATMLPLVKGRPPRPLTE